MKTTTLTLKLNGQPLSGAQVCLGEYFKKWIMADDNGVLMAELPDDFVVAVHLSVRHASIGTTNGSSLLIEAGGNYIIDYGNL